MKLLQPHVTDFRELFPLHTTDDSDKPKARPVDDWRTVVGPHCQLNHKENGYSSLWVSCSDAVMSRIRENMIDVGGDHVESLFFKVIDHGNGESLVVVSYNTILGSRWISHVRTETVPFPEA